MQNGAAYRAVLYTCVAAHWATLLTAMHLVGTTSINPLALLGERWNHTLLVDAASFVSRHVLVRTAEVTTKDLSMHSGGIMCVENLPQHVRLAGRAVAEAAGCRRVANQLQQHEICCMVFHSCAV